MDINQQAVNELKYLSAQIVSNAKSGHTGSAMGASSIMYSLFKDHLMFNPNDTKFINRDRLVFSSGHLSALYYSLLHLFGYQISSDDLKQFRKNGSITPGHPEVGITPGIEVSTGPLGQGIANAVGLAIAETMLEAEVNKYEKNLINNFTYCLCGDGCLMEGVAMEACSLAGTLNLNKLILLYDNNDITIDGTRELSNSENIELKFKAMNWNTISVENGNNYDACSIAIKMAKMSNKPTIIIFKTTIGIDTNYENMPKIHAYPMPENELAELKTKLNVSNDFGFSKGVVMHSRQTIENNINKYNDFFNKIHQSKYQKEIINILSQNRQKIDFLTILQKTNNLGIMAGRNASHNVLNEITDNLSNMVGGTADLSASTLAFISNGKDYSKENRLGKNIHFGIREHSMQAICNGIALYNNFLTFNSTFLAFSNYMLPAIRMTALMNLPVLNIFTHDSINIGQDGPTHQPIEQIGWLRTIINYQVFRPANYTELVCAYEYFVETKKPTAIIVSKNNMLIENSKITDAKRGGYTIFKNHNKRPQVVLIATGTEVELAINVAKNLSNINCDVVSIPCEKIFASQSKHYVNQIIPNNCLKVVIEASNDNVWYKYISNSDLLINVSNYCHSGNGSEIYKQAGFDDKQIAKTILNKLQNS